MIRFAFGFAKFAVIIFLSVIFGIIPLIVGVLLFVVAPVARSERDRLDIKKSWATPSYQQRLQGREGQAERVEQMYKDARDLRAIINAQPVKR